LTLQRLHAELLDETLEGKASVESKQDEDTVRASWRHEE
jgi:hypothetical protein